MRGWIISVKIDPDNITDYNRNTTELQEFWLFCLFVAGKNSDWAATKVEQLLVGRQDWQTPFLYLSGMQDVWLYWKLRNIKSGQYKRLLRAITESLTVDLHKCTLSTLLGIYGVGPKTSRFFLVHSRKNTEYAVLDTHILQWMGDHGVIVPKTTPSRVVYRRLEQVCLQLFRIYYPTLSIAEADLTVWKLQKYRKDLKGITRQLVKS